MTKTIHHSCLPAIEQAPHCDQQLIRERLMEIFGSPCRTTYYKHIKDYPDIPFRIKTEIDEFFLSRYHLSEEQIWKTWQD